jgi:hypothetical protein
MSLLHSAPLVLHNTVPTPPVLRGRSGDVARLAAAVDDGARCVTLLGAPGVGKTSIAATYAQRHAGVWVDLAAVDDEAGFLRAVADAVGSPANATAEAIAATLARAPVVLVLDNLEQLVGTAVVDTIDAWSRAAPGLTVVATSRVRLGGAHEFVVEVAPLPMPEATRPLDNDAVGLFIDRAVAAGASRVQVEHDVAAVVALVQRLDGLPLAIELAAAWTRVLTPRDLLQRLERGDVVTSVQRHAPRRHHSLSDAIASSWTRLHLREQQALAACARFDGPFTVAAAEQVIGAAAGTATPAIELIAGLRDTSLLHFDGTRLRLLVSIRDFVRARVAAGAIDVDNAAIDRAFVAALAAIAQRFVAAHFLLHGVTDDDIHVLAPREHQHLLTALALCQPTMTGWWRQRALLLIAVVELRSTPVADLGALLGHIDAYAEHSDDDAELDNETVYLLLLMCAQSTAVTAGRTQVAIERRAAFDHRAGARIAVKAYARLHAGIAARYAGDVDTAERLHNEVTELLADSERPLTRLRGVNQACLGRLFCDRGDVDAAWELNTAAATICDSVGEGWLAALARANLAQLECEHGRYDRAAGMLERALQHLQASAERKYIAVYAATYAGLCIERGHADEAARWLRLAHQAFDPVGEPLVAVVVDALTAIAAAICGDHQTAQNAVLRVREADARAASPIASRILVFAEGVVAVCAADRTQLDDVVGHWRTQAARFGVDDLTTRGPPWPLPLQHLDVRAVRRLLLRALDRVGVGAPAAVSAVSSSVLRVGPDLLWFVVDAHQHDLARKGAMRRILQALVSSHCLNPGVALTADALITVGWPGERVLPEAASTRLRTAISALRKLGLRDIIQTRDDGYVIAAGVVVEH